ncbi:MAG: DUF1573 domain-containing protein [Opitutaceae bacterium]|nr:DUF1573 domain-containing protein [Opitutaceae bacterium]
MLYLRVLLFGTIFAAQLHGLTFEQKNIFIQAQPADDKAEALFHFTNESDHTVTVLLVKSSCGCTVPELDKKVFAPGEEGQIKALFSFGARSGKQLKTITVVTDENREKTTRLQLEVDIPQLIKATPFFVYWKKGEQPTSKTIKLTVLDSEMIRPISVRNDSSIFSSDLTPTDDPNIFDLIITPKDTSKRDQSPLLIRTNFPENNPKGLQVYAAIR